MNLNLMFGQNIEDLTTNKKVATFLENKINKKYTFKEVFDNEVEADEEDFEFFVKKIDLDGNGYLDLVVNAYVPLIIVLNKGNGNYNELLFENSYLQGELDSIAEIGEERVLIFETKIQEDDSTEYQYIKVKKNQETLSYNGNTKKYEKKIRDVKFKVDSLTVKFGQLVKYKQNYAEKDSIKEFHFSTTGCYGNCPVFEMKLTSDRDLEFNGKRYTHYTGFKKFKLNQTDYNNLIGLIEYADLRKINDFNSMVIIDSQNISLKVVYLKGDIKEIKDNGLQGPLDLKAIYNKVFEIVDNIK